MLDELSAEEIVACVQLMKIAESSNAMVFVGDVLTTPEDVPGMISLAEKLNAAGERPDVVKYLEENY